MGQALPLKVLVHQGPTGPSHKDDPSSIIKLFGGDCHRIDRDIAAAKFTRMKAHTAFSQREQGVILADANVRARINAGAALADDNVAANHMLAAEFLNAKAAAC